MKKRIGGAVLGVVVLGAAAAAASAARIPAGTAVLWGPGEVQWVAMPGGPPGAQQAALWGDFKTGEHGLLYKWPAGTTVPVHVHSHGEHATVVAGTMVLTVNGAPKDLPAGSYFSMAGGTKHATACKPGADCVFMLHREGAFDATLIEMK